MNRSPLTARRTVRTLPAALLAAGLVLTTVAGSATAAKLVTSADIENGTIATVDLKGGAVTSGKVKNGSLARADLRPQSRTSVAWVHDNTTGIEVPTCADTTLEDCSALLTIPVVPGTQLITASGFLDNTNAVVPAISNRCGLVQGDDDLTEVRFALAANGEPGELASFTLQQVITVPDASIPVSLRCTEKPGEALRLVEPSVTSVRTGF